MINNIGSSVYFSGFDSLSISKTKAELDFFLEKGYKDYKGIKQLLYKQ